MAKNRTVGNYVYNVANMQPIHTSAVGKINVRAAINWMHKAVFITIAGTISRSATKCTTIYITASQAGVRSYNSKKFNS